MSQQKAMTRLKGTEDEKLKQFVDFIAPREPTVRIYRLEPDGRQIKLRETTLDAFSENDLRDEFGGGKFLLRTVRSNGRYGPSRVIRVASPRNPETE